MTKTTKQTNRFADLLGARDATSPEATNESAASVEPAATGKRSNAEYTQVTAYVRKKTHRRVKAALILDEQAGDFSDLVELLLQDWLARHV